MRWYVNRKLISSLAPINDAGAVYCGIAVIHRQNVTGFLVVASFVSQALKQKLDKIGHNDVPISVDLKKDFNAARQVKAVDHIVKQLEASLLAQGKCIQKMNLNLPSSAHQFASLNKTKYQTSKKPMNST